MRGILIPLAAALIGAAVLVGCGGGAAKDDAEWCQTWQAEHAPMGGMVTGAFDAANLPEECRP